MTIRGGRPRRPDSWSDAHARARFLAAERLDGILEPTQSAWLDDHLGSCPECAGVAAAYAAQRLELRALGDHAPVPPRDLWARTAAAIENEASFRDRTAGRRSVRSLLAPYALLSAALVVAVVVGSLTSSQRPPGDGTTASSPPGRSTAAGSAGPVGSEPGATPVVVGPQKVEWLSQDSNGDYQIQTWNIDRVCVTTEPCNTAAPTEKRPVDLNGKAQTVIGRPQGDQVIVVADSGTPQKGNVSVLKLNPSPAASTTPAPPVGPSASATETAKASTVPATPTIRPTPTPTPTIPPTQTPTSPPASPPISSPTASVEITPSAAADGTVQIAHDVIVVGQSAAYSPSGAWFAFTARPADESAGPDIFVWRVGDAEAHAVTTDHRSELGSWAGDVIVGSTAVETKDGIVAASFLIDPATGSQTFLPQTGDVWRPSVDASGQRAVYWTGSLRMTNDGHGFAPDSGRLVLGDWAVAASAAPTDSASSTAPSDSASAIEPSDGPSPTAPADQSNARHETTIAAGQMSDWDARWDQSGTRLAIWIADAADPTFGRLSLYAVDPFDGRVDLKKPLLDAHLAKAGYAISPGKLVWAEPSTDGTATGGRISVYAWTDKGSGTIETVPGQVIVIR